MTYICLPECPSPTDSDVKRNVFAFDLVVPLEYILFQVNAGTTVSQNRCKVRVLISTTVHFQIRAVKLDNSASGPPPGNVSRANVVCNETFQPFCLGKRYCFLSADGIAVQG